MILDDDSGGEDTARDSQETSKGGPTAENGTATSDGHQGGTAPPTAEPIRSGKQDQLREWCKQQSISSNGKVAELRKRLLEKAAAGVDATSGADRV